MDNAKVVLNKLAVMCESANKLVVDSLFVQCLDEAIEGYWKSTEAAKGLVVFSVHSSGDVIYEGIVENCADSAAITVEIEKVIENRESVNSDKVREFVAKSAEQLIETLQDASNKSRSIIETMEIASKAGELNLQTKKLKLLDRLLEKR